VLGWAVTCVSVCLIVLKLFDLHGFWFEGHSPDSLWIFFVTMVSVW